MRMLCATPTFAPLFLRTLSFYLCTTILSNVHAESLKPSPSHASQEAFEEASLKDRDDESPNISDSTHTVDTESQKKEEKHLSQPYTKKQPSQTQKLPSILVKGIKKAFFKKEKVTWSDAEKERPRTLTDVLREVNGVYIAQAGGITSQSSLFLRGGNPNHTLVISDGMRMLDPTIPNGSFNPAVWVASDFDVIDVRKGPLSSLHGADAVAGVISTDMRKGDDNQTTLSTLHGTFDTHSIDLKTQGSLNRFHYNVRAGGLKTQGYVVQPLYVRTNTRQSLTDPSHIASFHGRFDGDINDQASLTYISHLQTHRDDHNRETTNPFWTGRSQHTQNILTFNYHNHLTPNLLYEQKLLGGVLQTKRQDVNTFAPLDTGNRFIGGREQATWQHQLTFNESYKILGELEYLDETLKSYSLTTSRNLNLSAKSTMKSALISPTFQKSLPYNQEIALKAAFRYDHHSGFKGVKTYLAGVEYELPTRTRLGVTYGTAYKAPTLYQLYLNTTFTKGNSALQPERSHGLQYSLSQMIQNMVKAEVCYFQNHVKGLINSARVNNAWTYVNTHRSKIAGFESSVTFLLKSLKIKAAHIYLSTRDNATGQALLRRPRNLWHAHATYTSDVFDAGLGLYYKSKGLDVDPIAFTTRVGKSNKSIDGHLTYHATSKVDIFAKVENMFDYRDQQDPLGYIKPGFAIYGGVKVTI